MTITTLGLQNYTLLIAGIINLIMSILVFSRGIKHNKVNFYFSLMTFFNFLWAIGLMVLNLKISYELSRFMASFVYPMALVVVISLVNFIIHFPHKLFEMPKVYKFFISLSILFYSVWGLILYKIFVPQISLDFPIVVYYERWSYLVYSLILVSLMLFGIGMLFYKLRKAEGIFIHQLQLILTSVIIGTMAGTYFNLYFMYFQDLRYSHLGPLFTLVINFTVFYLIFNRKEK